MRRELRLPPDLPIDIVFLTRDGAEAKNADAIPTRYIDYALTTAGRLDPAALPEPARPLLAAWLSHLLFRAGPPGVDLRGALRLLQQEGMAGPEAFLSHLAEIDLLYRATTEEDFA